MKQIRKTSYLLLCFLIMFLFVGCGDTESNVNTNESEKVKVEQNQQLEANVVYAEKSTTNQPSIINGNLKIHFIDVGQADAILIQEPSGHNMLIDAGNNEDSNLVVNYLKQQGVSKLDYVLGTHLHEDHIGGTDVVINTFDIVNVILPKSTHTTKTYKDVLTSIKNKGLKITPAIAGSSFNLGNTKCEILAPDNSIYDDLNNYSVVIRLIYGNNSFLFTGDAEDISENEMLSKRYNLKSDLLKVGHHGSNSSTTQQFLNKVNPKYAVISVGKDNKYGHPTQSTLNKLNNKGIQFYRTDEVGTIIATSDGTNITIDKNKSVIQNNAPPTNINSNITQQPQTVTPTPQTNNQEAIVYITKSGKKYHLYGCSSLSKSKIPISLNDAKNKGYGACKRCNPPQ